MKETVKTSRVAGYLEAMYRALNARYFGGRAGRTDHHDPKHATSLRPCDGWQGVAPARREGATRGKYWSRNI